MKRKWTRPAPIKHETPLYILPPEKYPVTIESHNAETGELLWTKTIQEPGPVEIPPLAKTHNCRVTVTVRFADGTMCHE